MRKENVNEKNLKNIRVSYKMDDATILCFNANFFKFPADS